MRVTIDLPAPWVAEAGGARTAWTLPGTGIRVELDPLIPMPDDRKKWGEDVLRRELPAGGTIQQVDIVDSKGATGWPATVVSTIVRDAAGKGVEYRLSFFYEMLYFGAALVCRVPAGDVKRYEAELRAPIVQALLAAVADFRSPDLDYLGQIYEMGETKA